MDSASSVKVLRTPLPSTAELAAQGSGVTVLRTPLPAPSSLSARAGDKRSREEDGGNADVLALLGALRADVADLAARVSRVESARGGGRSEVAARMEPAFPPARLSREEVMKLIDHAILQVRRGRHGALGRVISCAPSPCAAATLARGAAARLRARGASRRRDCVRAAL